MQTVKFLTVVLMILIAAAIDSAPVNADSAAEMAKKLQNPLANIKAVMTDNSIAFNTGDDNGTSYGFQLQPVYAIDFPDRGFTFIPRAVIPILGLEPGTKTPITGDDGNPIPSGSGSVWGVGDSILQFFFAPHVKSNWKWGLGPQVSLATRTDSKLRGPDWGAGMAGVITGEIIPDLSFAMIIGNHWSFDGDFNTASFQPTLTYSLSAVPGAYVGYNAVISADWKADSDNTWTVPLGLTVGKAFDMGGGNGLDLSLGPYWNVVRPDGAADWVLRFGVTWLFP